MYAERRPSASRRKGCSGYCGSVLGDCHITPEQLLLMWAIGDRKGVVTHKSSWNSLIALDRYDMEATDEQAEEHLAAALQRICIEGPLTEARRVQRWTGYWEQNIFGRGVMTAELYFADNHKICGGGSDALGLFTCTGECQGTQVHFIKQYIGNHQVHYNGEINDNIIDGVWTIARGLMGNFHLEQESYNSFPNGRDAGVSQVGEMQHWTGYYKQGGRISNISGDILFTDSQNVYGSGVDAGGRFTWLGRYQQGSHLMLVSMTKQYESQYKVYYMGAVGRSLSVGQEDPKVVIKGSWVLSTNLHHGTFLLEPKVNNT